MPRSARHATRRVGNSARLAVLTPREREVFERVVAGKLNKQIADELGISQRTVKAHRAQLMDKLGVGSAAELGRLAGEQRNPPLKSRFSRARRSARHALPFGAATLHLVPLSTRPHP